MDISVIIPYHNETIEKIEPLMNSINWQIGVDFAQIEIILCNDLENSDGNICYEDLKKYKNIFKSIKMIKSLYKNNPGMSRQTGIDMCKGKYIFFCDADDSLYNRGVLRELLDNIKFSQADIYQFKFMEEIGGDVPVDKYVYNAKEYNWTWVFAKAYRIEFLRENGIRFAPENRWHEDTYFNYLCKYCAPKLININSIGYLWGFNADSITRVNNHEYTFGSLDDYFKSVTLAFRKILQEYQKDCYVDILHNILYYYYVFNEPTSKQSDKYEWNEKIYYNFNYGDSYSSLILGQRCFKGFLRLCGRAKVKNDKDGKETSVLVEFPKIELMSDLSISWGKNARPNIYNLEMRAYPVGEQGNQYIGNITLLERDIDADI